MDISQKAYISSQPFHSALAHELIHCLHICIDSILFDMANHKVSLNDPYKDFDKPEELKTVLGVRCLSEYGEETQTLQLLSAGRMPNIKYEYSIISQLAYDFFCDDITILRILYYNDSTCEDCPIDKELTSVIEKLGEKV